MSSDDVMISVRDLGKAYTIAHAKERPTTLAEAAMHRLRRPFARDSAETFWALKGVSFDVRRGEVVGVIGRNGAGKSTLFKVLSRITEPTTGEIDLYGRVGSLLEVGTGFSGELTGRENIYLNGTILGMRRAEIAKRFDEIVDFAGVDKFLDTPVKRYSSGMYVRLAFAVAAHFDPEILIVDEVLAVGDAQFQEKCLSRIKQVAQDGRTVLFVSHSMAAVERLCDRALVLSGGQQKLYGSMASGIAWYRATMDSVQDPPDADHRRRPGSGEYRYTSVRPTKPAFDPEEPKEFDVHFRQQTPTVVRGLFVIFLIRDTDGTVVSRCDSRMRGWRTEGQPDYHLRLRLRSPWLKPGDYTVDAYIDNGSTFVDLHRQICRFGVTDSLPCEPIVADALAGTSTLSDFDLS